MSDHSGIAVQLVYDSAFVVFAIKTKHLKRVMSFTKHGQNLERRTYHREQQHEFGVAGKHFQPK